MMPKLINKKNNQVLASHVEKAESAIQRMVGLLGRKHLESQTTLWIHQCRSIHTWFMRFSIDVVFVDKHLRVLAIYKNMKPWRMTLPILKADSVFEFSSGSLDPFDLNQGDQLDVAD